MLLSYRYVGVMLLCLHSMTLRIMCLCCLMVDAYCGMYVFFCFFFFQAEDGIRDLVRSRGLGDVYKRQVNY